jgi:hypothetical protein
MGAKSECPNCLEVFNGVSTFDHHRTGKFGAGRRCLTVPEMQKKGFVRGRYGYWSTPPSSPRTEAVA